MEKPSKKSRDEAGECIVCGDAPIIPETLMCAPCTTETAREAF